MKIAIVYDWIDKWGGVERLLLHLHELFPKAHWYTSYYDKQTAPWANDLIIRTSFIQKLPRFIRKSRVLSSLLYPYAFESFDLSSYDVVISISSAFAKSVITKPQTKHICYLLTPPRYLWGMTDEYMLVNSEELRVKSFFNKIFKLMAQPFISYLRKWDFIAAQRPDKIFTLSKHVAKRCSKYYQRDANVVYPPFDVDYWKGLKPKILNQVQDDDLYNYYLVVSRLEPYKKVDLVVDLFKASGKKLLIVGSGTQQKRLMQTGSNNITFIEKVSDNELAYLYSHAKALLMPQEEDFGYVSLEAQEYNCPIIAYSKSGVTETIDNKSTHIYFDHQSKESVQQALERFEAVAYNVHKRNQVLKAHFKKFSKEQFINSFLSNISHI